jgi:hypothetical protein
MSRNFLQEYLQNLSANGFEIDQKKNPSNDNEILLKITMPTVQKTRMTGISLQGTGYVQGTGNVPPQVTEFISLSKSTTPRIKEREEIEKIIQKQDKRPINVEPAARFESITETIVPRTILPRTITTIPRAQQVVSTAFLPSDIVTETVIKPQPSLRPQAQPQLLGKSQMQVNQPLKPTLPLVSLVQKSGTERTVTASKAFLPRQAQPLVMVNQPQKSRQSLEKQGTSQTQGLNDFLKNDLKIDTSFIETIRSRLFEFYSSKPVQKQEERGEIKQLQEFEEGEEGEEEEEMGTIIVQRGERQPVKTRGKKLSDIGLVDATIAIAEQMKNCDSNEFQKFAPSYFLISQALSITPTTSSYGTLAIYDFLKVQTIPSKEISSIPNLRSFLQTNENFKKSNSNSWYTNISNENLEQILTLVQFFKYPMGLAYLNEIINNFMEDNASSKSPAIQKKIQDLKTFKSWTSSFEDQIETFSGKIFTTFSIFILDGKLSKLMNSDTPCSLTNGNILLFLLNLHDSMSFCTSYEDYLIKCKAIFQGLKDARVNVDGKTKTFFIAMCDIPKDFVNTWLANNVKTVVGPFAKQEPLLGSYVNNLNFILKDYKFGKESCGCPQLANKIKPKTKEQIQEYQTKFFESIKTAVENFSLS